jgi:excisionase family DNA binding protein
MFEILRQQKSFLRVPDIQRICKVSKVTVYRLVAQGVIPHVMVGRSMRFDGNSVATALENRKAAK